GYIVPTSDMRAFLARRERLPQALRTETEDFQLTRYLAESGRRAWHPLPGIIDTRREISTTNPAISYPCRRSYLPWADERVGRADLTSADYWRTTTTPPDYGPTVLNDLRLPPGPFNAHDVVRYA